MKRSLALLVALALVLPTGPASADGYGWSLSNSSTDGCSNTGAFVPGILMLSLWYNWRDDDGLNFVDMTLISDNSENSIFAFTPFGGWLNGGTITHLLLLTGGCPTPPGPVGSISVLSNAPGRYCIGGLNVSTACYSLDVHPNSVTGFSNDGSPPCTVDALGNGSDGCQPGDPVSVEPGSWGSIKGLYR